MLLGENRRVYNEEFKREAVDLLITSGKKAAEIARDLGISDNLLRRWRKELEESGSNSFPSQGNRKLGTPEEEKIRR
ncbi:hypothetical protein JCM14036_27200 [Desulfotomaculum defluvii]